MSLPVQITNYLQADFENSRRPVCFLIDKEFGLLDWWGDAARHGFDNLSTGENMLHRAPYLLGHLGNSLEVLPFISTREAGHIEVHILPVDSNYHVIVMDASHQHDTHQQRQQKANEIRLLHAGQHKLISRQRSLIGELIEAKTELDHRRREAERSVAEKNEFIAMMSHEFRTPLSSIINYADLALENSTSISDIRKSAEAIARASRHMKNLVDTVLDDARLEAGNLTKNDRVFELRALFDDIAAIMAPLAAEKGLSFAIYVISDEVPEFVNADDVCLRQVLINLLGNAIKFTETGKVWLEIGWSTEQLRISVADTGPGIDLPDQKRIFQAFDRGTHTDATSIPGSGLGLTMTLELVKLMRGQIELVSEPGAGSQFVVIIPAESVDYMSSEESVLPEPADKFHAVRPATILLCDDDEDLLALAEYYLHRAGYGLLIARDGQEAVEKALAYKPDLVLMDINTPRLSGADAAARLRDEEFDAPIVALTASDVRKLDREVFFDSLRKPIQMPRLLAQIQSYIQ